MNINSIFFALAVSIMVAPLACPANDNLSTPPPSMDAKSQHPANPILSLEIEIGEMFHPFLSRAEQNAIWPEIWRNSKVIIDYEPTVLIEGKTQKTTRRFQIFGSLVGVAPTIDPGIKTKTKVFNKRVELPLMSDIKDGITVLHCEIPEQTDPLYRISGFEVVSSMSPFSRVKKLQDLGPPLDRESIRFFLFPDDTAPGFRIVTNVIPLSGYFDNQGGALAIRAKVQDRQGGKEYALRLHRWIDESDDQGQIPDIVKSTLLPYKVPADYCNSKTECISSGRILIMPKDAPRWHGLKYNNIGRAPTEGVRAKFTRHGAFSMLTLEALSSNDRFIEGIIPIRNESWFFMDGNLTGYRGEIRYFPPEFCANGLCDKLTAGEIALKARNFPGTSWVVSYLDGLRIHAALNGVTLTTGDQIFIADDCHWEGCKRNNAEALSQIHKSDANLESEGKYYLKLFEMGDDH